MTPLPPAPGQAWVISSWWCIIEIFRPQTPHLAPSHSHHQTTRQIARPTGLSLSFIYKTGGELGLVQNLNWHISLSLSCNLWVCLQDLYLVRACLKHQNMLDTDVMKQTSIGSQVSLWLLWERRLTWLWCIKTTGIYWRDNLCLPPSLLLMMSFKLS